MSKDFGIHVETPKETIERLNEGWNRCREELMQIIRERDELAARVKMLEDALRWYGEQARLAKLIHAEGDLGRHRLAKDGGERARKALEARK